MRFRCLDCGHTFETFTSDIVLPGQKYTERCSKCHERTRCEVIQ